MTYEERVLQGNPFDNIIPLTGAKTQRRTKLSDIKRENAYNDIINNIGWSRFKYDGFPLIADTLTSEMIERSVLCGAGVVYKVPYSTGSVSKGMFVCTPVDWIGPKKADNTSDDFITHGFDYSITKDQIGKYVIIRNNFEMTSDYDFTDWTATMLNETDISEMQLIKWSRMTPIAKVISEENVGKIQEVLRRVYNGEPWLAYSDYSKIAAGGTPTSRDDSVLRLTDETAIERMHFLSEFHYELIRRLCNLYNIPFHTTAKSAQNLESEIHNTDIFSRMITEQQLLWRKKSIEDFKKVFGWDITIELSDMFKLENKVIDDNIESINPDDGNDGENVSHETKDGENVSRETQDDEKETEQKE